MKVVQSGNDSIEKVFDVPLILKIIGSSFFSNPIEGELQYVENLSWQSNHVENLSKQVFQIFVFQIQVSQTQVFQKGRLKIKSCHPQNVSIL